MAYLELIFVTKITLSAEPNSGSCLDNPKFRHFRILANFFLFSVALLSADIITDILAAYDFYKRGHTYWSLFTTLPIFSPFFAKLVMASASLARCFEVKFEEKIFWKMRRLKSVEFSRQRFSIWRFELKTLFWHFPMLQPVRFQFKISIKLFLIKCVCKL